MLLTDVIRNNYNLRQGEIKLVASLMIYSFLLGVAMAFYFTMSITLFLNREDFQLIDLSWVYIFSGLLNLVLSKLFQFFQKESQTKYQVIAGLLFLLLSTSLLVKSYTVMPLSTASFFLLIWVSAFMYLKTFCFWTLVNNLLDLDQSKRLFGLIGVGEVLSNAFSFFLLPFLLNTAGMEIEDLGGIAIVALLLSMVTAVFITKQYVNSKQENRSATSAQYQNGIKIKPQYMRLIMLCLTSSILCFYFIDYIFLSASRREFQGLELAEFMAWFWGSVALLELISKTFMYFPLLKYFGIKFTLLLLPTAMLLITFALIVNNFSAHFTLALILILFLKLLERVLNNSVSAPSMQIIYQTFPDKIRPMAQAKIEGISNGYGNLIAGSLLLLITFFRFGSFYNYLLIMTITGCWIYFIIKLYHQYNAQLKDIISGKTHFNVKQKQNSGYNFIVDLASNQSNILAEQVLKYLDPADWLAGENKVKSVSPDHMNILILENQFDYAESIREKLKIIKQYEIYPKENAIDCLCEKLRIEHKQIKNAVIDALNHLDFKPQGEVKRRLNDEIRQIIATILWFEGSTVDLLTEEKKLQYKDLRRQLQTEKEEYLDMLFDLLGLLFGKSLFRKVKTNLRSKERQETNAFTLELINNFVNNELKTLLIPLFNDITANMRIRLLKAYFPQQKLPVQDRLIDILNYNYGFVSLWTKSLALHHLLSLSSDRASAAVLACQYHHHPLFKETAIQAIAMKAPDLNFQPTLYSGELIGQFTFHQKLLLLKNTIVFNTTRYEELIFLLETARLINLNKNEKFYLTGSDYRQKFYCLISGNATLMMKDIGQRSMDVGNLWFFEDNTMRTNGYGSYLEAKIPSHLAIFNPKPLLDLMIKDITATKKLMDNIEQVA